MVGWSRQHEALSGEKVLRAVYELWDRDLGRLDSYEGYPGNYNRLNVTVFDEDGEPVEAITYIKAQQSEETKPSKEYLSLIQQGCRDLGYYKVESG